MPPAGPTSDHCGIEDCCYSSLKSGGGHDKLNRFCACSRSSEICSKVFCSIPTPPNICTDRASGGVPSNPTVPPPRLECMPNGDCCYTPGREHEYCSCSMKQECSLVRCISGPPLGLCDSLGYDRDAGSPVVPLPSGGGVCPCPRDEFAPVCATDTQRTFTSQCTAFCAGEFIFEEGPCQHLAPSIAALANNLGNDTCFCSDISYSPVCAGGVSFAKYEFSSTMQG